MHTLGSGSAKRACSPATTMSQASAVSNLPPNRDAVDRRDHRLGKLEPPRQPGKARRRQFFQTVRGLIPEIIARAESAIARRR